MAKIELESVAAIGDEVAFNGALASPVIQADEPVPPSLTAEVLGRVVGVTLAECGYRAVGVWLCVEVRDALYEVEDFNCRRLIKK